MNTYTTKDRRSIVIHTALKMIYKLGYKGMTMRILAKELDFDVANLYNYFSSKPQLLAENLLLISSLFHTKTAEIKSAQLPIVEKIKALIQLYVRLAHEYPYHVSLLINEWRHLDEKPKSRFLDERSQVEQNIKDILLESVNLSSLNANQQEWATQYFMASLRWVFPLFVEQHYINPHELHHFIFDNLNKGFLGLS